MPKEILSLHLGPIINTNPKTMELFAQRYAKGSDLKVHIESIGLQLGEGRMIEGDPRGDIQSFDLLENGVTVGSILVSDIAENIS